MAFDERITAYPLAKHPDDAAWYVADFSTWVCAPVKITKVVSVVSSEPGELVIDTVGFEPRAIEANVLFHAAGGLDLCDYLVVITVELDDGPQQITRNFPFRVRAK